MVQLTTMLLMTFLLTGASSCGTATRKIVCGQIGLYKMKPLPAADISFVLNRCRHRCLDPNTYDALLLSECGQFPDAGAEEYARNLPVNTCEGLTGFFIEDVAVEIAPKHRALMNIKKDYCD